MDTDARSRQSGGVVVLMSDQARQERGIDLAILEMLKEPSSQWPWSVDEVVREIGDETATVDGLDRLYGVGLIHRMGRFVWPTRAALRAEELQS